MVRKRSVQRIFVYAMQSSGASVFAIFLGQIPGSVAVVDLWNPYVAPALRLPADLIIKATIGAVNIDAHLTSLRPTTTILWLRHPADIVASLTRKSYRDYGGTIESKLQQYEKVWEVRERFDLILHYEQLVRSPSTVSHILRDVGLAVPLSAARFERTAGEIVGHARSSSDWCHRHWRDGWGLGRARTQGLDEPPQVLGPGRDEAWRIVRQYCPGVLNYYEEGAGRDAAAQSPSRGGTVIVGGSL